jgi:hypothetical protein
MWSPADGDDAGFVTGSADLVSIDALGSQAGCEAYVMTGRFDQAGDLARRALDQARESGRRSGQAGPLRILADIAAQTGRLDEAEVRYREALEVAENLGMRPLAARCRHGLATISARRSEPGKAHDCLAAATAMYREMGIEFAEAQLVSAVL